MYSRAGTKISVTTVYNKNQEYFQVQQIQMVLNISCFYKCMTECTWTRIAGD